MVPDSGTERETGGKSTENLKGVHTYEARQ